MSSFIEWRPENGAKQPWLIAAEGDPLMVAALWDVWLGGEIPLLSCTLVTTAAAKSFEPWHQRMPVMLTRDECDRWLDNALEIAADDPVFRPELKFDLSLTPINKAVGNSRNKGSDVLVPVGDTVWLATS
jgi:putative SOS response-associated peptidase YedK